MRVRVHSLGRVITGLLLLAWLAAPASAGAALGARTAGAPPVPPIWPVPDLVGDIRDLLVQYYNQEATPGTPYYFLAPEWESDKQDASKDPDTMWEHFGGPGTACHASTTNGQFIDCAGNRLAATFGLPYSGGLKLFNAASGYYANDAYAQMAGYYALYHAFVRDFDAANPGAYNAAGARDAKRYHERMIRAYEAHMRDTIMKMFRDTRADAQFQADMTRSIGAVATNYARLVEAMEEFDLWASAGDRRNALALVNAINQRIWWEWVWTQVDGPRTAGFVNLGSEATYQVAAAADGQWVGTHQFVYDGETIGSLRPAPLDVGGYDGLWFDADYTVPGEWWCYGRYAGNSAAQAQCLDQAARESRDGSKSPFGQYYGPENGEANCDSRSGGVTTETCEVTNLGSIAEEWTWTFAGARTGMFLIKELSAAGDADTPAGAIGPNEYDVVTARLGYGISGWHGGSGFHDDLEWTFNPSVPVVSIRTMSGGRHDFEMQDGRFSLGETDVSTVSGGGRKGDTWGEDRQEDPGAIENHVPGPNPLYGSFLFSLVLGDQTSDGLSASFYDQYHRNQVDEFNNWIWLMQSTYYRCIGVADPSDSSCLAFSTIHWPNPATINRARLYTRPEDSGINLRFRYLWRDPSGGLDDGFIGERDMSCRGDPGLPWRHVQDWAVNANAGYLFDEGGFGAYNELLQGLGGSMRLLAARYPLDPVDPSLTGEYILQRTDVLGPWYSDAYSQVKGILSLFKNRAAVGGYGYVPDIENSTCAGFNPMVPGDRNNVMMLAWQVGTGDSVSATTARRAM